MQSEFPLPAQMLTAARDFSRLEAFLNGIRGDVYPEPPSEPHISITRQTIADFQASGLIRSGMRVLDIGCGQGLALEAFREIGVDAVGIALGSDCDVCRQKGFVVQPMDQNFMTFADESFDMLWCRHVLEHSIAPAFTLSEYRRVTKRSGLIYIEVPAPDTTAHHEANANHYSVLPLSAWQNLFARAGLAVERGIAFNFTASCGPDSYWSFLLRCDS